MDDTSSQLRSCFDAIGGTRRLLSSSRIRDRFALGLTICIGHDNDKNKKQGLCNDQRFAQRQHVGQNCATTMCTFRVTSGAWTRAALVGREPLPSCCSLPHEDEFTRVPCLPTLVQHHTWTWPKAGTTARFFFTAARRTGSSKRGKGRINNDHSQDLRHRFSKPEAAMRYGGAVALATF